MDPRSAEILEFPKIREILCSYAESSLGSELAQAIRPLSSFEEIRAEQKLLGEMMDAVSSDLGPPVARLKDIRLLVRRAAIGAQMDAGQLLEICEVLLLTGAIFRWRG